MTVFARLRAAVLRALSALGAVTAPVALPLVATV